MKTFRNVTISLGVLLLLYAGAYWRFARNEMRERYVILGPSHASDIEWTNWRKLFVPVVPLDYRVNVERPLRRRCAGHWTAADSDDFVTLARDGECSFRMGEFEHTGTMKIGFIESYELEIVRDGWTFRFSFDVRDESGTRVGHASLHEVAKSFGSHRPPPFPTEASLTRADAPD